MKFMMIAAAALCVAFAGCNKQETKVEAPKAPAAVKQEAAKTVDAAKKTAEAAKKTVETAKQEAAKPAAPAAK